MTKTYFITGTDTGVGKTVLSLIMMRYFYREKKLPFYFKPFQTGCETPLSPDSDAAFVLRHIPELAEKRGLSDIASSIGIRLREPKAPYFAAKNDKMAVKTDVIREKLAICSKGHDVIVLEGAGGLFVPVTRKKTIIDVMAEWGVIPVIAARAGLGTINHSVLTINALKKRGLEPCGIVFLKGPGDETDSTALEENMEGVEMLTGFRPAGVIPAITDFRDIPETCFGVMENLFAMQSQDGDGGK